MPKPATPARTRDMVNPFAHIEARKKAEEDAKKAAAAARQKQAAASRETVRTKSWYDYPFDAMKSVGDYLRGVKK